MPKKFTNIKIQISSVNKLWNLLIDSLALCSRFIPYQQFTFKTRCKNLKIIFIKNQSIGRFDVGIFGVVVEIIQEFSGISEALGN